MVQNRPHAVTPCVTALNGGPAPCPTVEEPKLLSWNQKQNFSYAFPASLCGTNRGLDSNLIIIILHPDTLSIDCGGIPRTIKVSGPENNVIESSTKCTIKNKTGKTLWEPSEGLGDDNADPAGLTNVGIDAAVANLGSLFTQHSWIIYLILIPNGLFMITCLLGIIMLFLQLGWVKCSCSLPAICGRGQILRGGSRFLLQGGG